ncbi:polyadenylate-binding protein, cytoplasmic and nuclear-like [Stegodyphus dumicola]|uniref:polyadenylate-binding protein, cytoplasmic and nuclear-like n=1 Tax=Stegodyphus dumicola TaxID=202533 RepID=UPI0015A9AD72|nr:polyadenylate-binding protein, cytoplasmic and nuclear-like [Stegodyphus dumicola]
MQNAIHVQNLDPDVDVAQMCDIFRRYGKILCASIEIDKNDPSVCEGYIQFQDQVSAYRSAREMNGVEIRLRRPLIVKKYAMQNVANEAFTKVFVKNFNSQWDDCDLFKTFTPFGNILKVHILGKKDKSRYGYVKYELHSSAKIAVAEMNDKVIDGKKITVEPFLEKEVREHLVKNSLEYAEKALEKSTQRNNLHVRNLPKDMSDEQLKDLFKRFGEIVSVKIVRDEHFKSKGFGFVAFKTEAAAAQALKRLNNFPYESKILEISYKQDKDARENFLRLKFSESKNDVKENNYKKEQRYASTGALQFIPFSIYSHTAKKHK